MPIPAPLQEGNGKALGPGEPSWPLSQGCVGKSLPAAPQMPLALTGFKPLKKRHLVFYFTPFSGRSRDVYGPEFDRLYGSPSKGRDYALQLYSVGNKKHRKAERLFRGHTVLPRKEEKSSKFPALSQPKAA